MHLYFSARALNVYAVMSKSHSAANKFFLFGWVFLFIAISSAFPSSTKAEEKSSKVKTEDVQSLTLDIWSPIRAGFQLPLHDSALVARQLNQLVSSGTHLQDSLSLAKPYLFFILEEVKRRGMPTELALLPLLESGFNIRLGKGLNHAGLWGLMPITARHLNLVQTPFKDERRDIVVSTKAALDLLEELHAKFGDWPLALAAYNWGPASLTRAIEYNRSKKLPVSYTSLKMPVETMAFVPKLLAIRKVIENPEAYNIVLPDIPNKPYFSQLDVKDAIDIQLVIKLAGISQNEFVLLNPSFNKSLIPAGPNQKLLLPIQKTARFIENYQTFKQALSPWRTVVVETPQTLDALARHWQVDPIPTRQMNGFRRGVILQPGTIVVIPRPSQRSD